MNKNWFFILLLGLYISCTPKKTQEQDIYILKKVTLEHANLLIESAYDNLLVNDKVSISKIEVDTLMKLIEYIDNKRFAPRIYRLKGLLHGVVKDFERSNYYLNKADSIFLLLGETADRALIANNKAVLMRGNFKEVEIEQLLLNSYNLTVKNKDLLGQLHLTHELCTVYGFGMKNHKKSIYYGKLYFKALDEVLLMSNVKHFEEIEHHYRVSYSTITDLILSSSYIALGEFHKAKQHLNRSLPEFIKHKDLEKTKRVHLNYMKIYQSLRDFKKFNHHLEEFVKASNAHNEFIVDKSTETLRINLIIRNELHDFKLLEKELISNKRINKKDTIIIQLLILAIILGMAALFYFLNQNKLLKKLNRIINEKNNNSIQLVHKLENIISDRKNLENKVQNIQHAIAKDLHDNFGNRLVGIISTSEVLQDIINSKNINVDRMNLFLKNLDVNTNQLVLDLKDLIWANDVKNNRIKEISIRFNNITKDLSKTNTIKISFNENFDINYILPQLWNRQLLLIFKEAINNACKYSNATQIETGLEISDKGELKLYIIDNGKGFLLDDVKKSGLFNMQKRVESIDCKLKINSSKEFGTEIIIEGRVYLTMSDMILF